MLHGDERIRGVSAAACHANLIAPSGCGVITLGQHCLLLMLQANLSMDNMHIIVEHAQGTHHCVAFCGVAISKRFSSMPRGALQISSCDETLAGKKDIQCIASQ